MVESDAGDGSKYIVNCVLVVVVVMILVMICGFEGSVMEVSYCDDGDDIVHVFTVK